MTQTNQNKIQNKDSIMESESTQAIMPAKKTTLPKSVVARLNNALQFGFSERQLNLRNLLVMFIFNIFSCCSFA